MAFLQQVETIVREIENEPNPRLRQEKRDVLADLLKKIERKQSN